MRVELLTLFFLFAVAVAVEVEEYEDDETEWDKFKKKFDRHYTSEEEIYRLAIFKATLKGIKEHNEKYKKNEVTWTQGINQFADLTHEEFANRYTMAKWVKQQQEAGSLPGAAAPRPGSSAPPAGVKGGLKYSQGRRTGLASPGHSQPTPADTNDEKLESDEKEWEKFKLKFHKNYNTVDDAYRFAIFKLALYGIREHNKKYDRNEVSWRQGVNEFTDLTQQEFESRHNLKPLQGHEHDGEKLGTDEEEWDKFKATFDRHYDTPAEETYRKGIFLATLQGIKSHNQKYARHEVSWSQGVNQFADLTQQEFENRYTMKKFVGEQQAAAAKGHQDNDVEKMGSDEDEWKNFKKNFDKQYSSPAEEAYRKGIFVATLKGIKAHNEKYAKHEVSYSQGVNQFADLTQQEFEGKYTMGKFVSQRAGNLQSHRPSTSEQEEELVLKPKGSKAFVPYKG